MPTIALAQPSVPPAYNIPLHSGCGVDHVYKDCSMRRLVKLVGDPKTTSLNLLEVERGRIAHIPLNAIIEL